MRKPAALFLAAFATVAGGGLAVAVEGSPASSRDVPDGPPFTDMEWVDDLPPGPPPHAVANGQQTEDPETTTTETVVEVDHQDEAAPVDEATPTTENHGAVVSEAARTCEPGPGHGQCVSAVARENGGGADDDDDNDADDDDGADDDGAAPGRSGEAPGHGGEPRGNGRGNGQGDD